MQASEAKIEIALLNANVIDVEKIDMITRLTNKGLPQEVITRIDSLWDKSMVIGGETIQIGKIITVKLWEFVEANPHMAVGAAVGVAVGYLISMLPFIGPILSPIATALGVIVGGVIGHRIDKKRKGENVSEGFIGFAEDLITSATEFFKLFVEILKALKEYFTNKK